MRCSVVIPCHNGSELTRACVESLLLQSAFRPREILLVDNASTDDTRGLSAMHDTVRVIEQPANLGFAGGVNAGLRAATQPFVLVLNNDTLAAANLLRELHAALTSDERIGAAAPVSNHVKGEALLAIGQGGRSADQRAAVAAQLQHEAAPIQDVGTLAGLCLLVRRATLDEIGPFDERFGHGNFEDDDFCLRLRLAGYRLVIARRAFLHHEGHATFRALGLDLGEQIAKRRLQYEAKWRTDAAGRAAIAALRGELAAAAVAAAAALRAWPKWPDADWHLARWHRSRGEPAAALPCLIAFLRSCPAHAEAAIELGCTLLALGRTHDAHRQFATALRTCHVTAAQQAKMLLRLGEHAYRAGRPGEAADDFRLAVQLAPEQGCLHNWLGLCLLADGDHRAAAAAFEKAAALGFALAHSNLGICWHHLGQKAAATASFARACELLPDDATARANLALVTAGG
ncbi:MAG TPA: glycosyltransferase [Planctomycetota bacterium]|nr:glycosyltransferase [Planctomycetota bacterium]